ncbi:MAG: adenylate/guanylate cyclase domain-containing protein [Flavobacteriales bacterium]
MRFFHRLLVFLLLILAALPALVAQVQVVPDKRGKRLLHHMLHDRRVKVPTLGKQVPGVNMAEWGEPAHFIGDSAVFAERDHPDSTWADLENSLDSVVPGATVHWVRIHLLPEQALSGVPMLLRVGTTAGYDVFLNGHLLVRSPGTGAPAQGTGRSDADLRLLNFTPITLACDGRSETIAMRLVTPSGSALEESGSDVSLHPADTFYLQQRSTMHYGIFIGINVIILLFAMVMWYFEPRERTWLMLALLSLVSVLGTYCDVGSGMDALGVADDYGKLLRFISLVLVPWPLYLLIMVLGLLRGPMGKKRMRWYTAEVLVASMLCAIYAVGDRSDYFTQGIRSGQFGSAWLLLPLVVGGLLFGTIMVVLVVEGVRLAILLVRHKGYARWVGVGALVSTVLSLIFNTSGDLTGGNLAGWFDLFGNYCSYVAVPMSVAIYLAVRSAHHNKLVSRQRDELDLEVKDRTAELSAEKDRSDALLLNILPEEVAMELKEKGEADAKLIDRVTVLFTDFKGYTAMSEQLSPKELVRDIHECFSAFDAIMEKHGVEKIKTIGDAYMAAGGLPTPNTTHALDVVQAALEVKAFIAEGKARKMAKGLPYFDIRIGVHTGPVVAGIVGVKKFQYDIWGDTVNTASRMESSGAVGQVNISAATYEGVRNEPGLLFIPRGKVLAKGKGELEMYFVEHAVEK